jgi:hypothetical protein
MTRRRSASMVSLVSMKRGMAGDLVSTLHLPAIFDFDDATLAVLFETVEQLARFQLVGLSKIFADVLAATRQCDDVLVDFHGDRIAGV